MQDFLYITVQRAAITTTELVYSTSVSHRSDGWQCIQKPYFSKKSAEAAWSSPTSATFAIKPALMNGLPT